MKNHTFISCFALCSFLLCSTAFSIDPDTSQEMGRVLHQQQKNSAHSEQVKSKAAGCEGAPLQTCLAARHGDPKAQEALGYMYILGQYVKQDYAKAAMWLTKSAKQGALSAQYNLGLLYAEGKGVPKDDKKAVYWVGKAASKNYIQAERDLGARYFKGLGVKQSFKKAFKLYQKAAEQGDSESQIVLGFMYALREGIKADPLQGYAWITVGLQGSHKKYHDAEELQKNLYAHLSDTERHQADKLIEKYSSKYKMG